MRAQATQAPLVRELVRSGVERQPTTDPQIGRTLFQLLVPVEIEPFLGGTTEMVLELDGGTAGIPWELLDTSRERAGSDAAPWAIRTQAAAQAAHQRASAQQRGRRRRRRRACW